MPWTSRGPSSSRPAIAVAAQPDAGFDDIVYFGADAATAETLFAKLAAGGLLAIVQGGRKFGRPVETQVGRVHYGGIRVVGTAGADPAAAYAAIPASPEIRPGDKINIVGAAGPMGTMHVIRDLCQGAEGVTVYAGDLNDDRLAGLGALASPLAEKNGVTLRPYNPSKNPPGVAFDYVVLMAPVPALAAQAVATAAPKAIINVFAGIPADKTAAVDLDAYVEKQLYFVGTSGSELKDMQRVLAKVVAARARHQLLRRCGVGPRRRDRRHSRRRAQPSARQDPRLSVLPWPQADGARRARRRHAGSNPAAGIARRKRRC